MLSRVAAGARSVARAVAPVRGFAAESASWGRDLRVASGVPPVYSERDIVIYSPARVAGQQGLAQTIEGGGPAWKVYIPPSLKWANPLMGWTSTCDPLENVGKHMYFSSKEAAVEFAESHEWTYKVVDPQPRSHRRPKRFQGYGDNFSTARHGIPVGGLRSEQK